jgi:NAD(P)-dependent dehydrogenase (short-subunit alcohol dehydrogenase family)
LTARVVQKSEVICRKLQQDGLDVTFCLLDVTDKDSVIHAAEWVAKTFGRLDVLVNNAGISLDTGKRIEETEIETFRNTLQTNLLGAILVCKTFLPLMEKGGYGRIVNVSSGKGSFHKLAAENVAYRISKTALNAFTRALADEVRDKNILVNAATPGWVRTHLGGVKAPRSTREGADTIVWLATLPDDGPRGGFFKDRKEFPW